MGYLPNHGDTLFRLARSLATRKDQTPKSKLQARISLLKFSWKGVEKTGKTLHLKQMYGLISCLGRLINIVLRKNCLIELKSVTDTNLVLFFLLSQ